MAGRVLVEDRVVTPQTAVWTGQRFVWRRPPWREPEVPLSYAVLYRDEDLLALAKPRGLPTMPGGGFLVHTLLHQMRKRYPAATPCHRLGRGTSGIVLCALCARARSAIAKAFQDGKVVKVYRALAVGAPTQSEFQVDVPIGPLPHPALGTVYAASPGGKESCTRVRVLERVDGGSILEARILTGRPHQIRIHLAAAGYPLVGDPLYEVGGRPADGSRARPGELGYTLHAMTLGLAHPATGREVQIHCPPPPSLRLSRE